MAKSESKEIRVEDLFLDLHNPRYPPLTAQREAIAKIATDQGPKLLALAEDIADRGLNPSKRILVTRQADGHFVVLEGNRRIAALKLLLSKDLRNSVGLSPSIQRKLTVASDNAASSLPGTVGCEVVSRGDANYWIQLEHTGENEGRGVVSWDGVARSRFRGESPALQAIDLVSSHLDEKTRERLPKISVTNIERLLNTPEARKALGVAIVNKKLSLTGNEDAALARLAEVVADVAHGRIKVTGLDSKEQRVRYACEVANRPLGQLQSTPSRAGRTGVQGNAIAPKSPRRMPVQRLSLIPRHCSLAIRHARINKIYDELRRLHADAYPNCAGVLLRVFLELSIDEYGDTQGLSFRVVPSPSKAGSKKSPAPRDMTLKEKLKLVADDLEKAGKLDKGELHAMRSTLLNRSDPLSLESLHAYVHNGSYSPSLRDLTRTWDNIEGFIRALWKG